MLKSSVRTYEVLVMRMEEWAQVVVVKRYSLFNKYHNDGARYAMKVARTVWSRGKDGDRIKVLPMTITGYADSSRTWRIYNGAK